MPSSAEWPALLERWHVNLHAAGGADRLAVHGLRCKLPGPTGAGWEC